MKTLTLNIKPQIIYEDEVLMVVAKPPGLVVHSDGRTAESTLADWLMQERPEISGVGESITTSNGLIIERPGIVHRIDRETSGVLLVAKTRESFAELKRQFQHREVSKIYNAFVWGVPKEREAVIDRPIGKSRTDFRRYSAFTTASGKIREARTDYTVLKNNGGHSYLEVRPLTGRTHQIRVHMHYLGHPIVCDKLYATKRPQALGFERLALHAHSIAFTHPTSGARMQVEAEMPEDFNHAIKLLNNDLPTHHRP
jgi:23S rRNA pseudouridine1911/1915/1917 synthase